MNKDLIEFKALEYLGKSGAATLLGNLEKAKRDTTTLLILYRLQSRAASQVLVEKRAAIRSLDRSIKKAESAGIAFPLGAQRLLKLREEYHTADDELAEVGKSICLALNLWQSVGATLEDLCNICNCDPAQVRPKLDPTEKLFSEMVFIHNLDYKNPHDKGWLEDEVDAPLTHAVKAHWIDLMLHTEAGRKAAHEAFESVFPEIAENALTVVIDADGIRHLIDKDGVEIGTVED